MADQPTRKLAVLLHADVVGSTSLVRSDEALAHQRIRDAFQRFSKTIASHGGIAHEIRGDALVAEFARASDAISASIAFQSANAAYNGALDDAIRPMVRVGIAMGEVVIADSTVTGEGVVLAQRLEQLAEPGGVVVQGSVSETAPTRMPFEFENMGEHALKGFDQPVRVFVAKLKPGEQLPAPEFDATPAAASPRDTGVSDKPSIAVLPFTNMSGDAEQERLSDGITEDIITNLSRFRDLSVVASNSSFAYKGKAVNVQDVSQALGVRYILEGSVQGQKDRVRINAQLIDGFTGRHLWAERYQRPGDDIFALQDEVVETIVGTLATGYGGRLRKAWQNRVENVGSENDQAFDCFTRGVDACDHWTRESNARGRGLLEEAIRLDPGYAKAYGKLAWTHIMDAVEGWGDDYDGSMAKGRECANEGLARDDSESWAHWALAGWYFCSRRFDLALSEIQKAVELNPNDADVLTDFGYYLSYSGRTEEGIEKALMAMRLNPHYPEYYVLQLGQIYFDAHRYEEAISTFESLRRVESPSARLYQAASYAALGDAGRAEETIARALELDPLASLEKWTDTRMAPYKNAEDLEHYRSNLRKAGLPE